MKTIRPVSTSMLLGAILIASSTRAFGAATCDDGTVAQTGPACCNRSGPNALVGTSCEHGATAAALAPAPPARSPILALVINPALEEILGPYPAPTMDVMTNDFANIQILAAATSGRETKTLPIEFAEQTGTATGTTDLPSIRQGVVARRDALISGSRATGFSFSFIPLPRGETSINGTRAGDNREWRDRDLATSGGLPIRWNRLGRDETREPQGLRLFSWSW